MNLQSRSYFNRISALCLSAAAAVMALAVASSCGAAGAGAAPDIAAPNITALGAADLAKGTPGAAYTMTNDDAGNELIAYDRAPDGTLSMGTSYSTGGMGAGEGLGNQGGIALSNNHRWIFVVNAGSNDVSVFEATPAGLELRDVEPSLGARPISVTVNGDLVYVLNADGAGSIHGFRVDDDGDLTPITDSMRPLSGAMMTDPAQIGFTPDGAVLAVSEKATSQLDTYVVQPDGTTTGPNVFASNGQTPFGFDFSKRGRLLVSEAFGGGPGMSAASSYDVAPDGTLSVISPSVPSGETAACWLIVNPNGRHAYTTNTAAGTVSSYAIAGGSDELSLHDAVAATTGDMTAPIDAAFSANGSFLYILNSGTNEIAVFQENKRDGSLTMIQTITGLPATANGLAAH